MSAVYRELAVLHLTPRSPKLATQGHGITQAMAEPASVILLPNPNPPLTVVNTHLVTLDTCEAAVKGGGPAEVTARDAARVVVVQDLEQERMYVQTEADNHPAQAAVIIAAAGMSRRKRTPRPKNAFKATRGAIVGLVLLMAAVAKGASYQWQMSVDQHNWTDLPPTMRASTSVSGLTPLTTYYFRYRTLTRKGLQDWTPSIALLVF